MQQQMLFARPGEWQRGSPAWSGSDSSSPRRVTFAVQSAPVVYRAQSSQPQQSPYTADLAEDVPSPPQPRRQQQPDSRIMKTQRSARPNVAARTRRPGWDTDVSHGTTLFDSSLKKSLLFQPRAGDRRKEEQTDQQHVVPKKVVNTVNSKRKMAATARAPVRYRSGPSSVYTQARQNVMHWPQRRTKDFVRQNVERLTGRPVDAQQGRGAARQGNRESVFERLSASRVSKALLRSHNMKHIMLPVHAESEPSPVPGRSPSTSSLSPPRPARAPSPALTIDPPAPDKQDSIRSDTPSSRARRSGLEWSSPHSSPQQSQQSFSSRPSPAPRSNSTNRSSGGGSRSQRYDNYPARVFGVLDRGNETRIGVSQILQGLRLLGLPATHNQISDYVYLIHEGRHSTIDLEEWEILVGTLDAASRPSNHSPRSSAVPSRSPSIHSMSERSPYSSMPLSSSPHPRGDHLSSQSPKRLAAPTRNGHALREEEEHVSTHVQREAVVSAEQQPIPDDDPYLEEIQRESLSCRQKRIEGMFERAQATAALRWAPEQGNNQFENDPDHSRSDRILKRAATVVYSLRASLFPLVHQAEATLREIQQRHGSKLSLFLPPGDMAAIAQNSDVLASAILDDILLDTVQLLNDEDKQQSYRRLESHQADQLDDILARIQEIEREEDDMIHHGLVLSYKTSGTKCDLPTVIMQHHDHDQVSANPTRNGGVDLPSLTLPLEVVMNINIPQIATGTLPYQEPQRVIEAVAGSSAFDEGDSRSSELEAASQQTLFAETPVSTSVLQGKRLQSIERRRHKFHHHRQLVESSLAETGMTQFAVIEILEELLLDDLMEQTAAELNNTVLSMSDTLLTNLL